MTLLPPPIAVPATPQPTDSERCATRQPGSAHPAPSKMGNAIRKLFDMFGSREMRVVMLGETAGHACLAWRWPRRAGGPGGPARP